MPTKRKEQKTKKANDAKSFDYLSFILNEIRWLGKTPAADELDALLPRNPALVMPGPFHRAGDYCAVTV